MKLRRVLPVLLSPAVTTALLAALPAAASAGTPAAYGLHYLKTGDGVTRVLRWNGCQQITYKVNLASVPSGSRTAVLGETHAAVRALAARTGFGFTYRGATTEVPRYGSSAAQTAEVVVAYTVPAKTNYPLAGATAGYGGYLANSWSTWTGKQYTYGAAITRGFVTIDTPDALRLKAGFGPGATRGNLLLHELGHVVGLDHVANTAALMNPALTPLAPNGYALGDRAGLAKVGRGAGCIAVPAFVAKDLG